MYKLITGAIVCILAGIMAFAFTAMQNGVNWDTPTSSGLPPFSLMLYRSTRLSFLLFVLFEFAIGTIRGFPRFSCGPLMVSTFLFNMAFEILIDTSSHNLWPIELGQLLFLAGIGTGCALLGGFMRKRIGGRYERRVVHS